MQLTLEQVLQMAPDEASAKAGKALQLAKHWQSLGQNDQVLWGECQGSALYQVRVDLSNLGYKCSCPSRKFPCKHVLGLFLLAVTNRSAFLEQSSPPWVAEWLTKRLEATGKKEGKAAEKELKPVDEKAQQKRAEQRHERVCDGLERLDLWMKDLVRGGLAGLETKGAALWDEQARRLVDAQAPGLALRVRRLGELPGSGPEWPRLLLGELGRIKLALRAFEQIEQLEPSLANDLRQWIGWTITSQELEKVGEKVIDDWLILGQWIDEEDKLRVQRTWCLGQASKRLTLMLQFVIGPTSFPIPLLPGTQQRGAMICYPGSGRQRAQFAFREEQAVPIKSSFAGHATIEAFLLSVAVDLARQPWLQAFGCLLNQVTLARSQERWFLRDSTGQSLPLIDFDAWKLLALSGGHPFDLAGEWDGIKLRPLGVFLNGSYRLI
ncbi:MAG TPA: SWIM zinc finger family protein [Gemmatales bacterium]|nr:SWIM zinc finger family protein [Gemmatales bacterium]